MLKKAVDVANQFANLIIAIATVFIAGLTVVMANMATEQAKIANLQWLSMQKALDSNERAWMIPGPPSQITLEANIPMILSASLGNFGRSPAFHVVLSWKRVLSINPPPPEPVRQGGENRGTFVPGTTVPVNIRLSPLNTSDTADINAGTKALFLIGDVLYSDPFSSGDRFTRVCFQYIPPQGHWTTCDLQTYR